MIARTMQVGCIRSQLRSNGCDSTATLNLTINNCFLQIHLLQHVTVTIGTALPTMLVVYHLSTNAAGCDSTATLNLINNLLHHQLM